MSFETKKPRVLVIGALPPPAIGPYIAMERLLASRELNDRFQVTFLDISDRRSIRSMGRFDMVNVWLAIRHALTCWCLLATRRLDLVYLGISQGTCGYLRDLTFLIPAILFRKRIVLHLRGSEFGQFYQSMPAWLRAITRWLLDNTSRVIVLGECLRPVFHGLIPANRICVIHNGIDSTLFSRTKASLPDKAASSRILYLAHLSRRKGIFLVLEAFAAVVQRFPSVQLSIAGQWQTEDERAKALNRIKQLGIANQIVFLGEVTGRRKIEVFHQHDLFLFTPVAPEGLPWVILEAMSAGLPVITTDQGAIREVVVDGVTGRIVSPSADKVAEAVLWMLEHPEHGKKFGAAGFERVTTQFSEKLYREKLAATLADVCRRPNGRTAGQVDQARDGFALRDQSGSAD